MYIIIHQVLSSLYLSIYSLTTTLITNYIINTYYTSIVHTTQYIHYCYYCIMNRQARGALGDRIRNSLQRTALRLKLNRLLSVQALTLHYPCLTIDNIKTFIS